MLFYLPHWIWKTLEDRKLSKITENLRGRTLNLEDRKEKCSFLVQYTIDTFHTHNMYLLKYFLCDALNLVNVIGQMFLINKFLGGVFMTYGTDVINWSEADVEGRTDPMIDVFPRVTKCSFHKYGPTGKHSSSVCFKCLNVNSSTPWLRHSGLIEKVFPMAFSKLFATAMLDLELIYFF